MTSSTPGRADRLLASARDLVNRAEHCASSLYADEYRRQALLTYVALDEWLCVGGAPPTDWPVDARGPVVRESLAQLAALAAADGTPT
jgi:hypothetical protein